MYTNDELIQKALEYVNSNNRVYKQIRLSAPPPLRSRSFNIRAQHPAPDNTFSTFVTVPNTMSVDDWKNEFLRKSWKEVFIAESPLPGALTYASIPDGVTHTPDVELPEMPMVLNPTTGDYEKAKHTGSYTVDYPDNYIQKFIDTNFDEESKYNFGWAGGSFLDWWRDLYRMRSAPASNKIDSYLNTSIRQALLQKIPHFGHSNYKDFAKYRKSNPTFKNVKGEESGLPDNDLLRSLGLGDSYTLFELAQVRDLEPGVHIDATLLQMALENLKQALMTLANKFEDPVDIEKNYRESIEQRLENFKKHQSEVRKKYIDPWAERLTTILSIGDKDKWGKYE
jgi:hypothetical protein